MNPTDLTTFPSALPRWEILRDDGALVPDAQASMDPEEAKECLWWMLLSRTLDVRGMTLQRQGVFNTYAEVRGQEATVVGAGAALDRTRDWLVPAYRELPAMVRHGVPLAHMLLYYMGHPTGALIPEGVRAAPTAIALGTQLPQAVGLAWGCKLRDDGGVVLAFCGDGASSEGDFHEACNFAGVLAAPIVFVVINNHWAISTPHQVQTAAVSFADRAAGYGFPGRTVDGNDLFAVYAATAEAVQRARAGDGPTLLECQTFRMGAHSTADDATRYVDAEELASWQDRDPIVRLETYLRSLGAWDDDERARVITEVDAVIDKSLDEALSTPEPDIDELFAHAYAEPPDRVRQQHQRLAVTERIDA